VTRGGGGQVPDKPWNRGTNKIKFKLQVSVVLDGIILSFLYWNGNPCQLFAWRHCCGSTWAGAFSMIRSTMNSTATLWNWDFQGIGTIEIYRWRNKHCATKRDSCTWPNFEVFLLLLVSYWLSRPSGAHQGSPACTCRGSWPTSVLVRRGSRWRDRDGGLQQVHAAFCCVLRHFINLASETSFTTRTLVNAGRTGCMLTQNI